MSTRDDWRPLYPFTSRFLSLGDVRMHYLDVGEGDVVLAVHGNPTWSFYWRKLAEGLRENCRVVAPDHVGCGLSDKPAGYPYRFTRHVENLCRFVKQLDLRNITLVGHDWGGPIGLGAALSMPDRFARFVLLNTGAWVPDSIPLRIRLCRVPLLGQMAVQGLNLFCRAALRMAVAHRERITPAVRAGLLAPHDRWQHRAAVYRFVKDIPLRPKDPSFEPLERIELGLPTLADRPVALIWGMRDWCFTPACLDRLCDLFPHARVHRLEDAGHWVMEDAAERVVPLVERFLADHPLTLASR